MVNSRVSKEVNKVFAEIQEYVEENKDPRERNNFKRKQLQFLKADVHKPFIPFRRCMLIEKRKKIRRLQSVQRKENLGANRMRKRK